MVAWAWALALSVTEAVPDREEPFWKESNEAHVRAHHSPLARVAKRALSAVVSITTQDRGDSKVTTSTSSADDQKGVGSGFVLTSDGYILTCSHVIEDALSVEVTLVNPRGFPEEVPAVIVGHDPETDFALLKVNVPRRLPVLPLGSSDTVEVADWVVAIGSPFGLASSVSVGVVSFKGRTEVTPTGRSGVFEYLQTDAAINPGNSGGPILNERGEVVAIANAVNVAGQGIGFAVPVDVAKAVLPELRQHGQVRRGWMGVSIKDLTPDLAEALGEQSYEGVYVAEVAPDGPADHAGLRVGDLITYVHSARIRRAAQLRSRVETAIVGQLMDLGIQRAGKNFHMQIALTKAPESSSPSH